MILSFKYHLNLIYVLRDVPLFCLQLTDSSSNIVNEYQINQITDLIPTRNNPFTISSVNFSSHKSFTLFLLSISTRFNSAISGSAIRYFCRVPIVNKKHMFGVSTQRSMRLRGMLFLPAMRQPHSVLGWIRWSVEWEFSVTKNASS